MSANRNSRSFGSTAGTLSVLFLMIGSVTVNAHHAVTAIYDSKKPIEVKGAVSKIEWINPHALLYLDVKEESGNTVTWAFEMGSPNILAYNGLPKGSLKIGDNLTIKGDRARDGSSSARAHTLTLDGKRFFNAENTSGPPPK